MHRTYPDPRAYTGLPMSAFAFSGARTPAHYGGHALHGFCQSCCHPRLKCCCQLECRKESRELLVKPTLSRADAAKDDTFKTTWGRAAFVTSMSLGEDDAQELDEAALKAGRLESLNVGVLGAMALGKLGLGTAFIGGGCCVHLSIEYAPSTPTASSRVFVLVRDSEGTLMAWGRNEKAGAGYQIKEGIITTKPGADLALVVLNTTARVRWCEIFSC